MKPKFDWVTMVQSFILSSLIAFFPHIQKLFTMIDYGLVFYLIAVIAFIGGYWIISHFKLAIKNFKNDLRIRIFIIDPRTERAYKEFYRCILENIDKRKEFYFLEMDKRIPNSSNELKKIINDIVNESYEFNRDNSKI